MVAAPDSQARNGRTAAAPIPISGVCPGHGAVPAIEAAAFRACPRRGLRWAGQAQRRFITFPDAPAATDARHAGVLTVLITGC
jgi:hypothetical protein